ncbi:MAG: hypothetical protein HY261_09980, partial [Chloroflexi bacterium]|nr:hypothetical protein [Chloroflexota bacterium]
MLEPLRSLLFVPANREKFLRKAQDLRPDALVPDLESGVLDPDKAKARHMLRDALPALAKGAKVFARVNPIDSPFLLDDLNAIISKDLTGVTLPKMESPDQVRRLDDMISNLEQGKGLPFGHVRIIPFIESALGVMRAFEIATASSRVVAIAFGAEDFTADMGVSRTADGTEVLFARNQVAVAARARPGGLSGALSVRAFYWLLVAPALVAMLAFYFFPLARVLWISVTEPRPGLDNYALLATSASVHNVLLVTARI